MTETRITTRRTALPVRRRTVAVVAGVAAMLTPMVAAPAAPARSLGGLVDEMLITGAGGPGGGKVDGIGPLLSAVLDGVSNILKPNQASTSRVKTKAKARIRGRAHH